MLAACALLAARARVDEIVEQHQACSLRASGPAATRRSAALIDALRALPLARTLDVACGAAFFGSQLQATSRALTPARDAARSQPRGCRRIGRPVQRARPPFEDGAFERQSRPATSTVT